MRRRIKGPAWLAAHGLLALVLGSSGCASGSAGGPVPPGVLRTSLPPIPEVVGPLRLRVEYPDSLQRIAARDSNFVFGSVGTGDATLLIDGAFVEVEPNGAFLAWLPVPARAAGDTAWYRLVARRGADEDTVSHPVLLPPEPASGLPGAAWIDTASLETGVERWALPDERLTVSVRGTPGKEAWLESASTRMRLAEGPVAGVYGTSVPAVDLYSAGCTADLCDLRDELVELSFAYVLTNGTETARVDTDIPLRLLDPVHLPVVEIRDAPDTVSGNDGIVVGRPHPSGPFRWRFPAGTRAVADGRLGDLVRLRLAPDLEAWVLAEDARVLPEGTPAPTSLVGDLVFETLSDRIHLRVPLASALPLQVEEPDPATLELTLFGARGNTDRAAHGAGSRAVREVAWTQLPGDRYRLTVRLAEPVWGYRASYRLLEGETVELLLDIRRVPQVHGAEPLRGRRIAIDAGHPGAGAYGPTGYYEGDANLAVGRILERLLRSEGAEPIQIRTDTLPMGLYERTMAAEEAGAELFVSIHNNALPDGVRPFGREGTSTYYYHPHSAALAEAIHEGMLSTMRLRDLGVYWGDLAVCRLAWMPSVLVEGAFMMIPSHEAALKDPAFQELYARGVVDGLRAFLASVAGRRAR